MRPKQPKISVAILWLAVALATSACTDWNAGTAAGPWVQASSRAAGAADAAATDAGPGSAAGVVQWDTWKAPEVATPQPDGKGDSADAADTAESGDTAAPQDATAVDIAAADAEIEDAAAGSDAVDTSYSLDGKADFVGWPELPPPAPDVPAADDVSAPDTAESDGTGLDGTEPDAGDPDAAAQDTANPDDSGPDAGESDVVESDVMEPDVMEPDVFQPDSSELDGSQPDAVELDIWVVDAEADAATADSTLPDSTLPDSTLPDSTLPDSTLPDSTLPDSALPDGAQAPDWQGYPDLPFAADADIYGGAIGSCLSMYLYQQELCGDSHPTASCINSLLTEGSQYAQFQFEPLRQCETAVCTDLCALATDKQCMESCVGKYCAAPFLACTSNGAQGTQSCSDAWQCSKQYPDKLLTISAKCYSAASAKAQQQFSAVIGCVSKPQTKGCIPEINACFSAGAAATASCSSSLTCINGCNNDEICGFTCIGQASPAATALIDAIWACSLNVCTPKCAGSSDPACQDDCMKSDCQSEFVQCLVN